jgi:uncharacterized coiled-coil protein SlyX
MTEQDLNSDNYEVAPLDTVDNESMQSQESIDVEAQKREETKDRDFRALRQRQKEMEWELKQKDELLNRFMQTQQPKAQEPVVEPEDADEDFVPAGKVKGIARRTMQPLEKKIQELESKLAQQEQNKLIQNLRTQYSDFDDVVNVDTLEILEKQEPELAATIASFKDPYKMGLHSYKYIKALGLLDKVPDARHKKEVVQKLERNAKTVQSPTAYDKRPMAQAFVSTQADNKRLYEEMMGYAAKANGF